MKVSVSFMVDIPNENVTNEQIEEWLRYSFSDNEQIAIINPLHRHEPEPIFGTFMWSVVK